MIGLEELLAKSALVVMVVQVLKMLFPLQAKAVVATTFVVSAVIVTMTAWPMVWNPTNGLVLLEAAVTITLGAIGERGVLEKGLGFRMDRYAMADKRKAA